MDSLNVFKVIPIEYEKYRKRVHKYKRIKVEELSKKGISDLYLNLNFRQLPSVVEIPEGFIIQYKKKPAILLAKDEGVLYSFPGKWELREVQHQASLVMRVLAACDLVEEHERISVKRRKK